MLMKNINFKIIFIASTAVLSANTAIADTDYSTYFSSLGMTLMPCAFTDATSDEIRNELAVKMRMARDDAASYIASSGEIRGPYIESALEELRGDSQLPSFDEPQLVQAVLAFSAY